MRTAAGCNLFCNAKMPAAPMAAPQVCSGLKAVGSHCRGGMEVKAEWQGFAGLR